MAGTERLGLAVLGGIGPIVSILVGDEADTLQAGRFLFEHGYYVQSVMFPAVPYHAGVLRIQVNANHEPAMVAGLLDALAALERVVPLPAADELDLVRSDPAAQGRLMHHEPATLSPQSGPAAGRTRAGCRAVRLSLPAGLHPG